MPQRSLQSVQHPLSLNPSIRLGKILNPSVRGFFPPVNIVLWSVLSHSPWFHCWIFPKLPICILAHFVCALLLFCFPFILWVVLCCASGALPWGGVCLSARLAPLPHRRLLSLWSQSHGWSPPGSPIYMNQMPRFTLNCIFFLFFLSKVTWKLFFYLCTLLEYFFLKMRTVEWTHTEDILSPNPSQLLFYSVLKSFPSSLIGQ